MGKVIEEADQNYRKIISEFENCWFDMFIELEIHFTNKARIIHLPCAPDNCKDWKGFFQSEEVVEATHSTFETIWKRYKVIVVESD